MMSAPPTSPHYPRGSHPGNRSIEKKVVSYAYWKVTQPCTWKMSRNPDIRKC